MGGITLNWKSFFLGLTVGMVSGYVTKEIIDAKMIVTPEKALANAKELFKQSGPINGSWIHMKTETFEKGPFTYTIYRGGISRLFENELEQYEFIADATTGTIIETIQL